MKRCGNIGMASLGCNVEKSANSTVGQFRQNTSRGKQCGDWVAVIRGGISLTRALAPQPKATNFCVTGSNF